MLMQRRIAACEIRRQISPRTCANSLKFTIPLQLSSNHARWDLIPGSSLNDSREQLNARVKIVW